MQTIPLIKRILFYLFLSPISLMVSFLFILLLSRIFDNYTFGTYSFDFEIFLAILIMHYVFGAIFLKTKLIIKLIVPFATSLIFGIVFWLIATNDFYLRINFFGRYTNTIYEVIINTFFIFTVVWETAYQILKRINSTNH
jgi:hypothetical protein